MYIWFPLHDIGLLYNQLLIMGNFQNSIAIICLSHELCSRINAKNSIESSLRCILILVLTLEHPKLTPERFIKETVKADPGTNKIIRIVGGCLCSQVCPKL